MERVAVENRAEADRKMNLLAAQKAGRDARYAARKARGDSEPAADRQAFRLRIAFQISPGTRVRLALVDLGKHRRMFGLAQAPNLTEFMLLSGLII